MLDVAIVGGGVSGIYSGWRLRTQQSPPSVALFETSTRLGGRLLSVRPPGITDTSVELGGMRFTSSHARVCALVDLLGLKKDAFPVGQPENIAYVRGTMLRRHDLTDAAKVPYRLAADERASATLADGFTALAAERIVRTVLEKDVPLGEVDWSDLAEKSYRGKPLVDLPMQYLIARSISQEAFRFAEDTSGYNSILHTWNAADGLPWNLADFGEAVSFFHLHDGFAALPLALAERFEEAGGAVHLQHRLLAFDEMRCSDGSKAIELHFLTRDGVKTMLARRLILAMPRRSLELLDQRGAVLGHENARVHELIASVTPIPLFKLALCYSYAWWETLDAVEVPAGGKPVPTRITRGQSITDLPLRQCYYWAKDPVTQNACVLVYDDGTDLNFWAGLRDRRKGESYASGGDDGASSTFEKYKAPQQMVEEAHRQLCIMHGVEHRPDIPAPYAASYRDWGEDPFGGGANFWHVGVESARVFQEILQPQPPVPVYICGEAYSHDQGWVEGALATADAMLESHFQVQARVPVEIA